MALITKPVNLFYPLMNRKIHDIATEYLEKISVIMANDYSTFKHSTNFTKFFLLTKEYTNTMRVAHWTTELYHRLHDRKTNQKIFIVKR